MFAIVYLGLVAAGKPGPTLIRNDLEKGVYI